MSGKKKKFGKKNKAPEEMELQITAMADIFTILLVFLMKSMAGGSLTIEPTGPLQLPTAKTEMEGQESVKLEIGENEILVDGKTIAGLRHFEFDGTDASDDGTSRAVTKAFSDYRDRVLKARDPASVDPMAKIDKKVLVLADKKAPYPTVRRVLFSAATQGFTDFKLVVMKDE